MSTMINYFKLKRVKKKNVLITLIRCNNKFDNLLRLLQNCNSNFEQ